MARQEFSFVAQSVVFLINMNIKNIYIIIVYF